MSEENTEQVATTDTSDADAVAAAVTTEGDGDKQGWLLAEGVNGAGDAPDWFKAEKYKSVDEQAKAYTELEGKFGSFTGAPDEYEIKLSEELTEKGVEMTADDPIMAEAMKFAKESGMNQDGFGKMVELYAMTRLAENDAIDQGRSDEMALLGNKAQERIGNLSAWGKANLSADMFNGFEDLATTAEGVKTLEHLIAKTRNAPISSAQITTAPSGTSEDVQKMLFETDEYGNRRISTDPAFKARYEKMRDEVWGSEENRIVVG